jgi:hypothetical protein
MGYQSKELALGPPILMGARGRVFLLDYLPLPSGRGARQAFTGAGDGVKPTEEGSCGSRFLAHA